MATAFNTGTSSVPPAPDAPGASEHPELLRSNRELAEKIAELYNVEESERAEIAGVIEKEIGELTPEEGRSLLRWAYGIEYHNAFLTPGRVMTRPDAKIIELHMRERMNVADRIYDLILRHTKEKLSAMREARGKTGTEKAANDSAFRHLGADMPTNLKIEEKVEEIERRLSDNEKILTWTEISEWRTFLQGTLASGIERSADEDGATMMRVQYLLTSVESLKNLNRVAIYRQRLLDSEGGRILVDYGYFNPDGSINPAMAERSANAIRDPVGLGLRAVALIASGIYTILAGTAFLQKKERGPFDALWVLIPGFVAAKMAGVVHERPDELTMIRAAEQKTMGQKALETASKAQSVMDESLRDIYEEMGGVKVAADSVEELRDILNNREKRDALSSALTSNVIPDSFLDEFAGAESVLAKSIKKLKAEDRLAFFRATDNPFDESRRTEWFAAVESVLRTAAA